LHNFRIVHHHQGVEVLQSTPELLARSKVFTLLPLRSGHCGEDTSPACRMTDSPNAPFFAYLSCFEAGNPSYRQR
jgi:hypothetical protein